MLAFLSLVCADGAFAQTEVRMRDSSLVRGKVQENSENALTLRVPADGGPGYRDVEIAKDSIVSIRDMVRDRDITQKYLSVMGRLGPEATPLDSAWLARFGDSSLVFSTRVGLGLDYINTALVNDLYVWEIGYGFSANALVYHSFSPIHRGAEDWALASLDLAPVSFIDGSVSFHGLDLATGIPTDYSARVSGAYMLSPSIGIGGAILYDRYVGHFTTNSGRHTETTEHLSFAPGIVAHLSNRVRIFEKVGFGSLTDKDAVDDWSNTVTYNTYRFEHELSTVFGKAAYSHSLRYWTFTRQELWGTDKESYHNISFSNTMEFSASQRYSFGLLADIIASKNSDDKKPTMVYSFGPMFIAYPDPAVMARIAITYKVMDKGYSTVEKWLTLAASFEFRL
jgi:hypothetical protein